MASRMRAAMKVDVLLALDHAGPGDQDKRLPGANAEINRHG